jgi:NDP-sugar pyrophosphorylase family protein
MKAIILAGGLGSRLKPFTEIIPKPLLPIGEKAVLEIQIDRLKKHGFDEIYLATNYKSDYIENFFGDGSRYGVKLSLSREDKPLGTAGPLTLLKGKLTEPFIVMNGDILSLIDFTKFYQYGLSKKTALTITMKKIITPYAFGNIFFKDDLVTGIEEKPDIITYALAGIYMMTPEIFNYIPTDTFYGMDLLIKDMLAKSKPIAKYEIEEYWLDIGKIEDYTKAQEIYQKHFKES